jgi:hypothetical protein
MSHVQKATAAVIALTISLVGSTLVTAPITLPASQHAVAQAHQWSATHVHQIAVSLRYAAASVRA